MKKLLLGVAAAAAVCAPAHAASEADVRGWLHQVLPAVMSLTPGNPQAMDAKSVYFTPTGLNGFKLTLERAELLDKPRQLGAACVIGARMAEGGTWIVDTQLVYRVPVNQIEAAPAPGDAAAPKARPNPWRYEVAQFYVKDGATANDVKINQYIPKEFPRDGFPGCRAPGEVEERAGVIDEQLSFYESTMATLQERIADLKQQKAALYGTAPVAIPAAPQAPMQPMAQTTQQILNAPSQPAGQHPLQPMSLYTQPQVQQVAPAPAAEQEPPLSPYSADTTAFQPGVQPAPLPAPAPAPIPAPTDQSAGHFMQQRSYWSQEQR